MKDTSSNAGFEVDKIKIFDWDIPSLNVVIF
jgi:hypothetical protein